MAGTIENLEKLFEEAVGGDCPLVEPSVDGGRTVWQPDLMSVLDQPDEWNYDNKDLVDDNLRFRKLLFQKFKKGELRNKNGEPYTNEQLVKLLTSLNP